MFDAHTLLWLVPAAPLFAATLIALLRKQLGERSHFVAIAGAAAACVFAFLLLFQVSQSTKEITSAATWFSIGGVDVQCALRADGLTAVMLVMVTFIGSFIATYSAGYMHHDPGYPRFFALVSLFLFFMTGLVLANNMILLYACWEGVGLCSYLLVGFWVAKPSAAAAARKAFLVTRLGDVGLFLGIITLWSAFGSLDFDTIFLKAHTNPDAVALACLLMFFGAAGKSAQFPLHVWLPDAMEGPSPVSALIHAATMVTAGVYLLARCTPLFALAPHVQLLVATIGGFTALMAALIALTQNDLKRVLAYSTISQLGYMFLALGSGLKSQNLAAFAVIAAMFHLFTHAFFKALLFLAAGSVMHAMGNVIDMRRFSGLRKLLPTTHWTFLCGAAALAGVPLLSGFWSKDEVLSAAALAGNDATYGMEYKVLLIVGLVTAALTAFYTFRAYFKTFWGEERIPEEAGHHAHESPPVMTVPLMVLAVGAVFVGIALGPTHIFEHFLDKHWIESATFNEVVKRGEPHSANLLMMLGSSIIALGGVALAYLFYVRRPSMPAAIADNLVMPYQASQHRFYFDEIYDALIVKPLTLIAHLLRFLDQWVVDGLIDLIGMTPRMVSYLALRPIHNGLVQFYAILMALGVTGLLLAMMAR